MRWGGQPAHCSLVASPMRKSASCGARLRRGTGNQQVKQRGKQLVGLRRREGRGVVGAQKGSRSACTRLDQEGKLQVSERFRRIARHVG
eukprot:918435-Pleurochrysis_carterae.AAC.1